MDVAGASAWLVETHPELADGALRATVIAGGKSNLTYRLDGGLVPLVLRRPPLGHVLSSAHDMAREHRVIAALRGSAVPVPEVVDLVDDTADARVTGTPFFVMRFVEGQVLAHRAQNDGRSPAALRSVSIELAEVLADLHAIDPARVGLADFGRGDGFLERQLRTWRRQLDASRSRDVPTLDRLQERLGERRPETARTSLVHGDYRLDNAIIAPDAPRIAAVLDWEMSTLGDPLVDLGIFGMYWNIADIAEDARVMPTAVDPAAGYPGFDELVDAYAARAGIAVPALSWYRAFAAYKLAVIAEGIHLRYRSGETVGDGFDRIGDLVEPLSADGLRHLSGDPGTDIRLGQHHHERAHQEQAHHGQHPHGQDR
ncbi:phosphotransferase family protein [Microbacterium rhizomatis]|uniref:Phosphotransferase family protein n=1 Tax=Microbacterium rhizomatis TaxID=1631477 RepID=A0A5J5J965_9MICO|nr:phosphotransferase family protein [Microbacterium rhizomatis]